MQTARAHSIITIINPTGPAVRRGARCEVSLCDEFGASDAPPQFVRRIVLLTLRPQDLLELGVVPQGLEGGVAWIHVVAAVAGGDGLLDQVDGAVPVSQLRRRSRRGIISVDPRGPYGTPVGPMSRRAPRASRPSRAQLIDRRGGRRTHRVARSNPDLRAFRRAVSRRSPARLRSARPPSRVGLARIASFGPGEGPASDSNHDTGARRGPVPPCGNREHEARTPPLAFRRNRRFMLSGSSRTSVRMASISSARPSAAKAVSSSARTESPCGLRRLRRPDTSVPRRAPRRADP